MRLEELLGEGGCCESRNNMMFVGDLLQLPPVGGSPVFEKISAKALLFQLGCAASLNILKECVVYDELTINERQKKDEEFSSMLNCVRCGYTLNQRVPQVSVADKFTELHESGQSPVCLFPTRKACANLNNEMLARLSSKIHDLVCTDELDQTASTHKWTKKSLKTYELSSDCNMTAGLEAKLSLAVGARMMLRCNIDTKAGLVNGTLGTVLSITAERVTVQFDHMTKSYNVAMVKSKFMVIKNFYVYRKQFPRML